MTSTHQQKNMRLLIMAAGTGGHIFPGLAIADTIDGDETVEAHTHHAIGQTRRAADCGRTAHVAPRDEQRSRNRVALARLQQGTQKMEWEIPLLSEPGEKWNYSASTRVLGLVVEKITGTTLEEYYQEHIFKPLGMVDTSFAVAADKQSRISAVASRAGTALQQQPRGQIASTAKPPYRGDGGLYSTAHDYGLFIRMLLNGGHLGSARILSAHSVQLMGQNQIGPVFVTEQQVGLPALTKPFPLGAGRDKFGLGFQITAQSDDTLKYRSAGSMSWAGLFNTEFWIDPKMHVGGILLMQYLPFYDDGAIRTLQKYEETVYRGLR